MAGIPDLSVFIRVGIPRYDPYAAFPTSVQEDVLSFFVFLIFEGKGVFLFKPYYS